jgi:hypothetical protein
MNEANAFALPLHPPAQTQGEVVAIQTDGTFWVAIEGRRWLTQRAASCLLKPDVGDIVLLMTVEQQLWLLAVLTRAHPTQAAHLHCDSDLHLSSAGTLQLSSPQFKLNAAQGTCDIDELKYHGKSVSAWVNVGRFFGKQCESIWESVSQFSQRLLRKTAQCEQVRAGQLDVKTEDFTRLHAKNTFISSKTLTRMDAKQIHMG